MKPLSCLKFLCALVCSLVVCHCFGQATLKGDVSDGTYGDPLIGANVIIKGTAIGTTTDWDGSFEFKTSEALPLTLEISYLGYTTLELTVSDASEKLKIKLKEDAVVIESVEVKGQRISDKQKSSPLTVESLDVLAIKETAASNFYDGLGALKDVDLTAASLGFKVINTRGFNSTSPVRSLQIIDGVDNQAPGLNFSLGNFLGASELDVLKVDLIVGASSAFYGPNAFNGVINMTTKNPFFHQGLSAKIKFGERNLINPSIRYADIVRNKDSLPVMAYKINFSYLAASDWEADNYGPVDDSNVDANNPGRFDAVNIYGDEPYSLNSEVSSSAILGSKAGLGTWSRTGYREIDLVDYDTRNYKAGLALHFRTQPDKEYESPEIIISSSFGSGTTVYQGDNRFSLKNILFYQNRIELAKKDKYFLRLYATHEDAGDSYDPYFTALRLQEAAKSNEDWSNDYRWYWENPNLGNIHTSRMLPNGYPKLTFEYDPVTMTLQPVFDTDAALQWMEDNRDSLALFHSLAEAYANGASEQPGIESTDFFEPGSDRFEEEFNRITKAKSNNQERGTRFFDKSALYHVHGEYKFEPTWTDHIIAGANARIYRPKSEGTIFSDSIEAITNWEVGAYVGIQKKFFENQLTTNLTVRGDKNENFDFIYTPAVSAVWNPAENNYIRASFSSAIRNPTLQDQYLYLDVGRAILAGNLEGVDSLITVNSFIDYLDQRNFEALDYFSIDAVKPEKVKTFELGYRTTLFSSLYVDAGYYYSIYDDFLGYNIGVDADIDFNDPLSFPQNVQAFRYAANSTNQVTTQGFSIGLNYYFAEYFMVAGNYSFNKLNKDISEDPIIPAFNTPENKYNLSFSGRNIRANLGGLALKNFGFNINYKWVEGFLFEGSPQFTGFIEDYGLLDFQINYTSEALNTTFKIGASNILNNEHYETYGGPLIGRLAYFSVLYDFKKK